MKLKIIMVLFILLLSGISVSFLMPTNETKQNLEITVVGKILNPPSSIDSQIYVNNQLQENEVIYNQGIWQLKLSELESVKAGDSLKITFSSNGQTATYTTTVGIFPVIDAGMITLR